MKTDEINGQMIPERERYIDSIKRELLGPGSEFKVPDWDHELISSSPKSRYSIGILYPQGNRVNLDNDETEEIDDSDTEENLFDDISDGQMSLENKALTSRSEASDENSDKRAVLASDDNLDEEVGLASQYLPSSMGITFLSSGNVETVQGKLSFATYRKAEVSDCVLPFYPDIPESYDVPAQLADKISWDKETKVLRLISKINTRDVFSVKNDIPDKLVKAAYRFADFCRNGFVREPHNVSFELNFSESDYIDCNKDIDDTSSKITALRTKMKDGSCSFTIMLVNSSVNTSGEPFFEDSDCLFQPKLEIFSDENDFVFVDTNHQVDYTQLDEEERSLDLLYRNKKIYGTGLGVAVDWKIDKDGKGKLWSDYFPEAEVPQMSFDLPQNEKISSENLSMKFLSDLSDSDKDHKLSSLKALVGLYESWVKDLENDSGNLEGHYKETALRNIEDCRQACERMYAGINILENNDPAYDAFLLANRSMFMQRVQLQLQTKKANKVRYPDDEEISSWLQNVDYSQCDDSNARWRPFQIAFLLMDIGSIVNDDSPERDLVDLIWFPTGGGKTEAYLGLTAFTIFYRRLAHSSTSGGTSVIMRYTLRLLTTQQFTRASTLICACEYIRKTSDYPLGIEPITIGLWIGGSHIPNKNTGTKSAKEYLDKLLNSGSGDISYTLEANNKFQILKCPWCGTSLIRAREGGHLVGKWGYRMKNKKHFYLCCTNENCPFEEQLPIQIIDEELYKNPPTLLFGTVDKFAMLSWKGEIGTFFGVGNENRAPELIIQDELHLISGALGTIVGLYETAIDAICSQKGTKAKIIASTATIRRAKEQCSALYNRDVVQFPAPGINAEDSFFAREKSVNLEKKSFGRRYVGIMPSGKTKAMMEIRAMAGLLQTIEMMSMPDEIKDKLWTLTVYFGSLRDLGKSSTLVEDDIKDFIIRTANRKFSKRRLIVGADELTSRVNTTGLNKTLDKLEKLEYSTENVKNHRCASNILLATNMISVGIDVARLNVMLMVGQPKLVSEYIQASSRVGRSYPGVVFVQYDSTKSRDRSYYERFKSFHESFYRFVEPTGATPFSKPARERALHAVLVSVVRNLTNHALVGDEAAIEFNKEQLSEEIEKVKSFILDRVKGINTQIDLESQSDIAEIDSEINTFFDQWQETVTNSTDNGLSLYFGNKFMFNPPSDKEKRLLKPFDQESDDNSWKTLTSMRNVDSAVTGKVITVWGDDND